MTERPAFVIRPAAEADLASIVELYNHYVEHTPVTFDTELFDVPTRRPWFERFGRDPRHPLLVAAATQTFGAQPTGSILGYASASPFHPKAAYETSVETSIYVRAGCEGHGLGKALYRQLLEQVTAAGAHRAYAGITQPNPASQALHEALGFRVAARYSEVGFKLGRYWDVHWLEKKLVSC